jgi:hypothetical protein
MKPKQPGERSMFSRFVLLGMVGALGITLPGGKEASHWLEAANSWAVARLADWDGSSASELRVVHHRSLGHSAFRPVKRRRDTQLARSDASAGKQAPTAHLSAPVPLRDLPADVFAGVPPVTSTVVSAVAPAAAKPAEESRAIARPEEATVLELDRTFADLGFLCGTSAEEPGWSAASAPQEAVDLPDDGVPVALGDAPGWSGDLEGGLLVEICRIASEVPAASSANVVPEGAEGWAGCFDEGEDDLVTVDSSASPAWHDRASASGAEPAGAVAPDVEAAPPAVSVGSTEPAARPSDPALGRAFRLTRDAVLAWMNILTGPPLVRLSTR